MDLFTGLTAEQNSSVVEYKPWFQTTNVIAIWRIIYWFYRDLLHMRREIAESGSDGFHLAN